MPRMTLVRGALVGAGLMYLFDPVRGSRRRSDLLAKVRRVARIEREIVERGKRDAANRVRGAIDHFRAPVPAHVWDDVLEPRVRSKLGHVCSHPRAVLVDVVDGHVTLAGPILADEATRLVHEVAAIRGVQEVLDALDRHATSFGVPALEGVGKAVQRKRLVWSPIAQLLAVGFGSALISWGLLARRGWSGLVVAAVGGALAARGTINRPLGKLPPSAVIRRHRRQPHRLPTAHVLH